MADASDRCDECGFVYDLDRSGVAGGAVVDAAAEVATLLVRHADVAAARPDPSTWSALEYGCHVRDVLIVQRERVLLALRVDEPTSEPMGREERAEHDGYSEQLPVDVARQLTDAATLLAHLLGRLPPEAWERTLVYNYPEPSPRTLRWVAVHTEHEARHHLDDIRRQLGHR